MCVKILIDQLFNLRIQYPNNIKPTYLKNIIAVCIQYHNALIEMMVFHSAGRVQNCQRRLCLSLKSVISTSVIQIVAKTSHEKPQHLQIVHKPETHNNFERSQFNVVRLMVNGNRENQFTPCSLINSAVNLRDFEPFDGDIILLSKIRLWI